MKEIMSCLFKDPINSGLAQFDHAHSVKNGFKAKKIKLPQMNFFLEKLLIKFLCTYQPLSFCTMFKNSWSQSRVMRMFHFRAQNDPFVLKTIFLLQTIVITSIYLLALFIAQNLKKFLQWVQSYEDAPFLGPKWSICHNFFKIINIILIYLLAPFVV